MVEVRTLSPHRARLSYGSFEITIRNHKKDPVEVRVVEHLYRWTNWEIKRASHDPIKTDGQTVEFRVRIAPDGEQTIPYTVHYSRQARMRVRRGPDGHAAA